MSAKTGGRMRAERSSMTPLSLWPVLMTATIAPPPLPHLTVTDPQERWRQYESALRFWTSRSCVRQVVFCDNSGFPVDYAPIIRWAREHGKTIEVFSYAGNQDTVTRGRAYGEGELIRYALGVSRVLGNSPGFFKVTSRIIVENFDQLERLTRRHRVVVSKRSLRRPGWADTRFFKMDCVFYRRHLMTLHETADGDDWILGDAYAMALGPLDIPSFPRALRIHGVAGNGASYYDGIGRYLLKSLLARSGLYRIRTVT